ncbi:MAG: hypothetical protein AKCLJLPJ_00974 [Fimbriimonadales bacterium]|nr:hypothetical protein [Fimbriimonadales bacterium]
MTGSWNGTIEISSTVTGDRLHHHDLGNGASGFAYRCKAISPNGEFAVVSDTESDWRLIELSTGNMDRRIAAGAESTVAFLSDEEILVCNSRNDVVSVAVPTQKTIRRYRGFLAGSINAEAIVSVAGGARVLAECVEGRVAVRELPSGRQLCSISVPAEIEACSFDPAGRILAVVFGDGARLYDARTGALLVRLSSRLPWMDSVQTFANKFLILGDLASTAHLWSLETGGMVYRFEGDGLWKQPVVSDTGTVFTYRERSFEAHDASTGKHVWRAESDGPEMWAWGLQLARGGEIVALQFKNEFRVEDFRTRRNLHKLRYEVGESGKYAISPDGRLLAASHWVQESSETNNVVWGDFSPVSLIDIASGKTIASYDGKNLEYLQFAGDGNYLLIHRSTLDNGRVEVYATGAKEPVFEIDLEDQSAAWFMRQCVDAKTRMAVRQDGVASVVVLEKGVEPVVTRVLDGNELVSDLVISRDAKIILAATWGTDAYVLTEGNGEWIVRSVLPHEDWVMSAAFIAEERFIATASRDGTVGVWATSDGALKAHLSCDDDGFWSVTSPSGHFDANLLESQRGLQWILEDQPFTPLGIEVFMRQYYEPKLLARILRGENLPEVKNILDLNRVQPFVEILEVKENAGSETASITVKVAKATGTFERDGKQVVVGTSAHDLRLFRDGRLVRHVEGDLISEGQVSRTFVFEDVPLPRGEEKREVRFTAYCFNDDDVKSQNANAMLEVVASTKEGSGKVFAICFGADDYEGDAVRDLKYAAADAKAFQKTFTSAFANHAGIEQVVALSFVSEFEGTKRATKETFKSALDLLCGRQVSSEVLERAPDLKKLTKATPDDIVIVTFSGHGVSGDDGKFYLVPSNIKSKETLREDSISSDELSEWFRDLDALEMAFILDACHSAKAIEQEGFKPGPMGARGLGQLAYDKGMLVLAATQAEDVALEVNKLQHGLLTYALVEDGYIAGKAKDANGFLGLQGWLKYAESRVPEIYAALAKGEDIRGEDGRAVIFSGSTASMKTREDLQRPSLFDFLKTRPQIEMVQATTGDVWTQIWGLIVNNASVLSDGAAFDEAVVEFWRRVVMNSIAWSRRSA